MGFSSSQIRLVNCFAAAGFCYCSNLLIFCIKINILYFVMESSPCLCFWTSKPLLSIRKSEIWREIVWANWRGKRDRAKDRQDVPKTFICIIDIFFFFFFLGFFWTWERYCRKMDRTSVHTIQMQFDKIFICPFSFAHVFGIESSIFTIALIFVRQHSVFHAFVCLYLILYVASWYHLPCDVFI